MLKQSENRVSDYVQVLFRRFTALTGFLVMLLLFSVTTHANLLQVDETDNSFSQGNNLTLLKEPDIKEFTVTTTADPSRVSYPNNPLYHNFQQEYGAVYMVIKNVQPTDSVTAWYKNIGTYKGQPIDLRIVFSDFNYARKSGWPADEVHLQISESPYSGYVFYNMSHGYIEYSFYDSATGQVLNLEQGSFLTFNSLNGANDNGTGEFFNYLNYNTWEANSPVDAYLIKGTNVRLKSHNHMPYKDPVYIGVSNNFHDKLGSETFTRNSVSFQIRGAYHKFVFGSFNNHSAWQAASSAILFNVTQPTPVKSVQDVYGNDITGGRVMVGEKITYRIGQTVHVIGQDIMEPYHSFVIKDALPAEVAYVDARMVNENGEVLKNAGDIQYDSGAHTVTFKASEDFLAKQMAYNGETYFLEIDANVKDGNYSKNAEDNVVLNKASSKVNNITKNSNPVTNLIETDLPEISLKKVQIYTQPFDKGLPIYLHLLHTNAESGESADLDKIKVKAQVKEVATGNVIIDKTYLLSGLPELISQELISADTLEDGAVKQYEIGLSLVEGRLVRVSDETIKLDGHTSKRDTLTEANVGRPDGPVIFKGVVMTERELRKDMKAYYETLTIKYKPSQTVKSGYGYELYGNVTYQNELMQDITSKFEINRVTNGIMVVDNALLDPTLAFYQSSESTSKVGLSQKKRTDEDGSSNVIYQAPNIFLEQRTGLTFTEQQKEAGEIIGRAVDAGNRLYIPVWIDELGEYPMWLQSEKPLGVHEMRFNIKSKVKVPAYMFHHADSSTPDEDEILIKPILQEEIPID